MAKDCREEVNYRGAIGHSLIRIWTPHDRIPFKGSRLWLLMVWEYGQLQNFIQIIRAIINFKILFRVVQLKIISIWMFIDFSNFSILIQNLGSRKGWILKKSDNWIKYYHIIRRSRFFKRKFKIILKLMNNSSTFFIPIYLSIFYYLRFWKKLSRICNLLMFLLCNMNIIWKFQFTPLDNFF